MVDETTKAVAAQANDLVRELIMTKHRYEKKSAALDKRLQKVKDELGPEVEELKQHLDLLDSQVKDLVRPRFKLLSSGRSKTIKLRSGEISKRFGPPKLALEDNEAILITRVRKAKGVRRFIRKGKESLDRVALKKDPSFVQKIKGMSIVRDEFIVIRPSKSQGEIILTPDITTFNPSEDAD